VVPESTAAALQAALDAAVEDGSIRGATAAVVIVDTGSWSGAAGVDPQGHRLTADSQLMTASVGKTMTAAQILRLVDEGRLRLDERAADRFPPELSSFTANDAEIQDLLGMRSGLRDPGGYVVLVDKGKTTADLVELIREPTSPPGSTTEYANINYLLLGEIIEEVTGRPLADAIRAGILNRPGLEGIAYPITSAMAADGWQIETDPLTLARWGYELYGGFVVSDAALRAMTDFRGEFYGLGTVDFADAYDTPGALGHGGMEASHVVRLVAFPNTGIIVAVQANANSFEEMGPVVNELRKAAES
jgi:D-alanyl-D-alanine carboxypeptidase